MNNITQPKSKYFPDANLNLICPVLNIWRTKIHRHNNNNRFYNLGLCKMEVKPQYHNEQWNICGDTINNITNSKDEMRFWKIDEGLWKHYVSDRFEILMYKMLNMNTLYNTHPKSSFTSGFRDILARFLFYFSKNLVLYILLD